MNSNPLGRTGVLVHHETTPHLCAKCGHFVDHYEHIYLSDGSRIIECGRCGYTRVSMAESSLRSRVRETRAKEIERRGRAAYEEWKEYRRSHGMDCSEL